MRSTKQIVIIATVSAFMTAPLAFAGDMKASDMNESERSTAAQYVQANYAEDVLGAVDRPNYITVTDENGNVFLNKVIDVDALPDPQLDVDVIDTYTYEYQGRVYTNKIVREEAL